MINKKIMTEEKNKNATVSNNRSVTKHKISNKKDIGYRGGKGECKVVAVISWAQSFNTK